MYEYRPETDRVKVLWKVILFAVGAAALFGVSRFSWAPIPSLWQLGAMIFAGIATVFAVNGLMRQYVYCVSPRVDREEDAPDLTVTEYYGKRISVVCRVSVREILEILPSTGENRKKCRKEAPYFAYTSAAKGAKKVILRAECGGTLFFAEICADEGLLRCLQSFDSNICPNDDH